MSATQSFRLVHRQGVPWRSVSFTHRDDFEAIQLGFLQVLRAAIVTHRPMAPTMRALAEELRGGAQRDVRRLAGQLEAGVSLPNACEQFPSLLDEETILTIRIGSHSGLLIPGLDKLIEMQRDRLRGRASRPRFDRLYWISMTIVTLICWSFLMLRIYPTLIKIFDEFAMQLPAKIQIVGYLWNAFVRLWPLILLGLVFLSTISIAKRWERWLWRKWSRIFGDGFGPQIPPITMEWIALALRFDRPLSTILSTLAKYHFHRETRGRLLEARNDIELGTPAWEALSASKMISPSEFQFLTSHEKANLQAYFLESQARQSRSQQERWSALKVLLSHPLLAIVFGLFVGLICISFFELLVSLITSLS
ncbi:type II secretion system F family protein [Pirellulaceae bacterium SH467]